MLAEIYNWFTEGFGTADLKNAKALEAATYSGIFGSSLIDSKPRSKNRMRRRSPSVS